MNLDFDSLNSAIGLAGDVGDATGSLSRGLGALKGLFKKSQAGGDADIKLALSELALQVANAQMANADLKLTLAALQEELAQVQAFKSDLDRYALWETPAGAVVYRLERPIRDDEPTHYLCPNCIAQKPKPILQGHAGYRKCPSCQTGFAFEKKESHIKSLPRGEWIKGY